MSGTLILLGMKHSGKSKLGRLLAERLGIEFIDVDDRIEAHQERASGERLTVREILRRYGEEGFARLEAEAVGELRTELEDRGRAAVVAVGGRTPLNPQAGPALAAMGRKIFLDVEPALLWERIERKGVPPFLGTEDPQGEFMNLCARRTPLYRQAADVSVRLEGRDLPQDNLRRLLTALEAGHAR